MMFPSKRPASDLGGDDDQELEAMVPEPKRRAIMENAVRNIMGFRGLSLNRIVLNLEPMLRSWVREEVERATLASSHPQSRSSLCQIGASRGRRLKLHFVNKLSSTIFTGSKVEAEDGSPMKIILVDAISQTIASSGSLSSVKVEIVVLNGEFGADDREDWTENEFNASVLREREGKKPLLIGDLSVTLVNGAGTFENVVFTDNSSWIRSRKFRLGARIVQRIPGEMTIREARSEAFVVKDHRGELYKKHHPPFLHDEVWRLERIAKDGAFHTRLASKNIFTVKDFLRLHVIDPSALRNILGGGISNKVWDTIIEHACSCVLADDDEWYTYYGGTAQRVGLLLNSIYQAVAATFDGQTYQPLEKLTFSQNLLVEDAKRQAYENVRNLVPTDRRAIMAPSMLLTNQLPEPLSIPSLLLQQPDFSVANQDQPDTPLGFNQSPTSYAYEVEDTNQSQVSLPHDGHAIQAFNPMLRNSFRMGGIFPYNGNNSLSLFPDNHHFAIEDDSQAQMPSWISATPKWGQGSGFGLTPSNESSLGILSSSPIFDVNSRSMGGASRGVWPKARWLKLRAVIQWRSIRRGVARKRLWLPEGMYINDYITTTN